MPFHQIKDPERLHALIDAILLIEADANLTTLLENIVESATTLVGARYGALGVLANYRAATECSVRRSGSHGRCESTTCRRTTAVRDFPLTTHP